MSDRLQEIFKKLAEFERETPYNYCDRWCERCVSEKQLRCKIYQDELEQKLICIALGKEERDPDITKAVMKRQLEETEKKIEECLEESELLALLHNLWSRIVALQVSL